MHIELAKAPIATEHQEQCAVIEWWALACATFKIPERLLFAIANAGAGAQRGQAGKMKGEGVRPGAPDLCLAVARGGAHGLYVEMKRRGERPRLVQTEFLNLLNEQGYRAVVCQGADEAIKTIGDYLRG